MRRAAIIIGLLAVWIVTSGSAVAFQQAPTASETQTSSPKTPENGVALKSVPDGSSEKSRENESQGVNIPGIGSIGILPKLNFGLELLYGAPAGESSEESAAPDAGFDDVTIRGSVKRRF